MGNLPARNVKKKPKSMLSFTYWNKNPLKSRETLNLNTASLKVISLVQSYKTCYWITHYVNLNLIGAVFSLQFWNVAEIWVVYDFAIRRLPIGDCQYKLHAKMLTCAPINRCKHCYRSYLSINTKIETFNSTICINKPQYRMDVTRTEQHVLHDTENFIHFTNK